MDGSPRAAVNQLLAWLRRGSGFPDCRRRPALNLDDYGVQLSLLAGNIQVRLRRLDEDGKRGRGGQ